MKSLPLHQGELQLRRQRQRQRQRQPCTATRSPNAGSAGPSSAGDRPINGTGHA
jgi:hypothetical protein